MKITRIPSRPLPTPPPTFRIEVSAEELEAIEYVVNSAYSLNCEPSKVGRKKLMWLCDQLRPALGNIYTLVPDGPG